MILAGQALRALVHRFILWTLLTPHNVHLPWVHSINCRPKTFTPNRPLLLGTIHLAYHQHLVVKPNRRLALHFCKVPWLLVQWFRDTKVAIPTELNQAINRVISSANNKLNMLSHPLSLN